MKCYTETRLLSFLFCSALLFQSCEKKIMPVVITGEISDITGSTAVCSGTVISEGSSPLYTRGVCWSIDIDPTIDDDFTNNGAELGDYSSTMTKLSGSTKYYVRAYATNGDGTGYGETVVFRTAPRNIVFNPTLTYGYVTDIDGNSYRTIQIGEQTWMAENLKSTHFNDGTEIPLVTDSYVWGDMLSSAYCYYENDTLNKRTYGALYNWHAVSSYRNICPEGWHVPTDAEYTILEEYLGGSGYAGMKMKEISQVHWVSPNVGATNESGFTAVPGGSRYWSFQHDFWNLGYYSIFWTSTVTQSDNQSAYYRYMKTDAVDITRGTWWTITGFSVRCIKD